MNRSMPTAAVIPVLGYADVPQAAAWLCRAFGFAPRLTIGTHRIQLDVPGGGAVVVAQRDGAGDGRAQPAGPAVMVRVADADSHHATAVAQGATLLSPPATQPYGERQYSVVDIGGHAWTFSQTVADVDPASWGGELAPPAPAPVAQAAQAASAAATAAGYDAVAAEYARQLFGELQHKRYDRDLLGRFVAALPAGPVLDVGCGPGQVGRHVHTLGRAVTGIDISPQMIAHARALNPQLQFAIGDMRAPPYAPASFAGIVAFYAVVHLTADELPALFRQFQRLLLPQGLLALSFHVGREVRHVERLWGIDTDLDFVFFDVQSIITTLREGGWALIECGTRAPYEAAVEAQTERCYLLARAPSEASRPPG